MKRLRSGVLSIACGSAALLCAIIGFNIWRQHENTIAQAEVRTQNMARVLEENTRQTLKRVELSLINAEKLVLREEGQVRAGALLSERTRLGLIALMPADRVLSRILVRDPTGAVVLSSSEPRAIPGIGAAELKYLEPHRDPASPPIIISPVIKSVFDGKLRFIVTHRITEPDGRFGGTVGGGIEPAYFQRFYDSIDTGKSGLIAVYLDSGWLLARSPFDETLVMRNWMDAPLFREYLRRADTGTVRQVAASDGVERIYSYRRLKDYPVVVLMGESLTEDLAPWRGIVRRSLSLLAVALAALGAGTFFLLRQLESREAAEARVVALNRDLEQRVAARTAELTATNQDLEQAVRELEDFSYSVSHDLRAPLRAIGGFANIFAEDEAARLSENGLRKLAAIEDNANRMGRLVDNLLEVVRVNRASMNPEPLDLAAIGRSQARDFAAKYPRTAIEIGAMPQALADPVLMRLALHHLLDNALKYSAATAEPRVEFGYEQTPGAWFVRDNGIGFDMRYADKIFDMFHRLHGAGEFTGTGTGLAIVRRIINRHGGRVWAEATPCAGATIWFSLPAGAS